MSTLISYTCEVLIWVLAVILLVVRFISPTRMPWWLMVAFAALLSSLLVTVIQGLTFKVEEELLDACLADPPQVANPAIEPCPMRLIDYYFLPWYLRWIAGLFVLALLLPIYGLLYVVKKRHRAFAA